MEMMLNKEQLDELFSSDPREELDLTEEGVMIKPGQLRMTDYGTNHTYLVLHQIKDDETYSKTAWSIMLFYEEGDAEELVWYEDDLLQDILLSDSEK